VEPCHALTCQECEQRAEGTGRGWEAYLYDVDDDGNDEILVYCPVCAAHEFHRYLDPVPHDAES